MMGVLKRLAVFLVVTMLIPIDAEASGDSSERPLNSSGDFSPRELKTLEMQANRGDGSAANQLAGYYAYVRFDVKKQRYWLERAAECGYVPAKKSLIELLRDSSRAKDRARAARLLKEISK